MSVSRTNLRPPSRKAVRQDKDLRVVVMSDAVAERNGVGTYYSDLVEYLRERLGSVQFFYPDEDSRMRYKRISVPMPGDDTQRLFVPRIPEVWRKVDEARPHVIVSATPGPFGLLGRSLSWRFRASLLVGFHTHIGALTDMYFGGRFRKRFAKRSLESTNKVLFRTCEAVLVNGTEMARTAKELGARRVELVGTPVSPQFAGTPVSPAAEKVTRILYAGRLAPEKNVPAVLEAAERLPGMQFFLAGDGPLRTRIVRRGRKLGNLNFLGWLNRGKLLSVLDEVDMLVLPSHMESFGTVALEAMVRGKLVLVSASSGILGWPDLAKALFRIEPGEDLAHAISRVAGQDAEERKTKAWLARQAGMALNRSTIDHWVELVRESAVVADAR
ncbi:MAG: glycosyltransferase [Akkermansiaceae bacterium]|nr:glycosyltransferase [Akkermansiaceae bacterium]NNM29291.1 glycosyltransferase [Akkermansiaceae bacterium]